MSKLIAIQSLECSHDFPLQQFPQGSQISLRVENGMIEITIDNETFTLHENETLFLQGKIFQTDEREHPILTKLLSEITCVSPSKKDAEVFKRVTSYMKNNLSAHLTLEQLCHENMISRAHLQKIFHAESGYGVIEYFLNLKIDTAKNLIQNGGMNFTQISEQLGYSSVHYFSRQFKKLTGMTPSEYASSMKF